MKIISVLKFSGIAAGSLVSLIMLSLLVFLFSCRSLGGSAGKEDREDYARRASNYYDGKFHNEENFPTLADDPDEDEMRISTNEVRPGFDFPVKKPDFLLVEKDYVSVENELQELTVTWFGHSSLLIHMHGMNVLFDPVFSEMISPVSFLGARRYSHSGITVQDLPEIDLVIITHDHYDHLDYDVIKEIDSKVKKFIVPLGVENHLIRWGVDESKITNMAWWETADVNGLTVVCTPSQHFSGRRLVDNMTTLWAGWILMDEYHKVFESGDSGFGPHFEKIHEKYGDFELVLIECGQYNKRWPKIHMFPEESARAAKILGAKITMPVHWGAVVLSSHGWDDPVERIIRAAEKEDLNLITPYLSQTVDLTIPELYKETWWRK